MMHNEKFETAGILGGTILIVYYLFKYTTLLGPYGTPGDVYHFIILVAILFISIIIFQTSIRRRGQGVAE